MRTIVTGGAGFIGSHLADELIAQGHEVTIIDNLLLGKRENINQKAHFVEVDIRDKEKMIALFAGHEVVFHLAADPRLQVSIEDPIVTHDINVTGTLNVLEAARLGGVRKVIFSSSCAIYGEQQVPIAEIAVPNPLSPYGLHKLMGEYYCRLYSGLFGLETICLRYFNVFGPRKTADGGYPMVIPVFLRQRQNNEVLTIVGDGEQTRDYIHVRDVVAANIAAALSNIHDGTAVNIGSGKQTSVNEIAAIIGGETKHMPAREGEMRFIEANNNRARTLLSWEPTVSLETGLQELKTIWGVE
jgi:UDP-glucose 4-epimerase